MAGQLPSKQEDNMVINSMKRWMCWSVHLLPPLITSKVYIYLMFTSRINWKPQEFYKIGILNATLLKNWLEWLLANVWKWTKGISNWKLTIFSFRFVILQQKKKKNHAPNSRNVTDLPIAAKKLYKLIDHSVFFKNILGFTSVKIFMLNANVQHTSLVQNS